MHITSVKIEKVPVVFERPLTVAYGVFPEAVNWLVKINTDEGLYGIGAASPFAPVTGETPESCFEVLKLFSEALVGDDPRDIGGLYNGLKIADIAAGAGISCMVGCMCETKVSLAAGVSLVAAHQAVTEADCDSFLLYRGGDDGISGCFERNGGTFTLSDRPGFGAELDF